MMEQWSSVLHGLDARTLASIAVAAVLLVVLAACLLRRRGAARAAPAVGSLLASGRPTPAGLWQGLAKTRGGMLQRLLPLLGRRRLDAGAVEELEAALVAADVGVHMTRRLIDQVQTAGDQDVAVGARLTREILRVLESVGTARTVDHGKPHVIMVTGVNGVGKTTSIGKLAARYRAAGKRVLLVAADTFRAAAIEQLAVWAERSGADLVRHQHGADPGAVAYDGMRAAVARDADIVIVDTAGRLHTKSNLMEELRKVRRVIAREIAGAPHETLLVIDAVTGQNGLMQARAFLEKLEVTGVVLTKLDGTAKGGIVVAIAGELGIPIRYVGVGEGVQDLRDFDASEFASALLANGEAEDQFP